MASFLGQITDVAKSAAKTFTNTTKSGLTAVAGQTEDSHAAFTGAVDRGETNIKNAAHNVTTALVGPQDQDASAPASASASASASAPASESPSVPPNKNKKGLMAKLTKIHTDAMRTINHHKTTAMTATQEKKKEIAKKLGVMAADHAHRGEDGQIISYGTPDEPGFSQEQNWFYGKKSQAHAAAAAAASAAGRAIHNKAFTDAYTTRKNELKARKKGTSGGARKHKRKTMKRKSNKRKHKKRHATKKRKHKKRHQTKKRKLKKKAHKKKAHKKKHRRTRKQRGGQCPCSGV